MNDLSKRLNKLSALKIIEKNQRYQVRFWSNAILYDSFRQSCDRMGLNMQEAFNEFMLWYSERILPTAVIEKGYLDNCPAPTQNKEGVL